MFEKTLKAIQEMDAVVVSASETKKKTFEYINANYRSKSELMNQKIEEMNHVYESTCASAAEKVRVALEEEVSDAKAKIEAIVVADVPESFTSDLAVIEARQGKMSDYEVELYVNKYRHNYPAIAALHKTLSQDYAMMKMVRLVHPDQLIEEMDTRKADILKLVKGYNPSGYVARLMRKEENPVANMALRIQMFVNGNFMVDPNITVAGNIPV